MTKPGPAGAWIAATRPKTLVAGIIPVIVGSAFAWRDGVFDAPTASAALLGALLIQIGTNLANDYYDHARGADARRVGPPRAAASGWIRPRSVLAGALVAFGLAALVGLYLVAQAGWPILVIGVLSLASGYAYTGGPYPLGYHGWGDLFVFVFFGLIAVTGTYYVQGGTAPPSVLVGGASIGAAATAILVVNNLRDIDPDRSVSKRTMAVRLGPTATRVEYTLLLILALAAPALLLLWDYGALVLLPLIVAPLALLLIRRFWRARQAEEYNRLLAATSAYLLLHGVALSVGVVVS